jgi:pyruvyl transferase EpsO
VNVGHALLSEPQRPPRSAAWVVAALQRRALDVLASVLPRHRPAVLLDFPNHANVGDSAIWAGQIALLRRLGVPLSSYSCSVDVQPDMEQLRHAVGERTILLNGGGNFGDLWPQYQEFRERVVSAFPNNRIIQLSQTMYFRSREALDRTRALFDQHSRLTLLFRDRESLALAQREFGNARVLLCPDMAFGLGRIARPSPPSTDVVVLSRTDRELSVDGAIAPTTAQLSSDVHFELDDWLTEPPMRLPRLVDSLEGLVRRYPRRLGSLAHMRGPLYERLSRLRLQVGTRFLSRGRVVVTNRLHGHILCMLMDIPHVFLDNSYHKNLNFYESWTRDCELSHWCDEPRRALSVAQELL